MSETGENNARRSNNQSHASMRNPFALDPEPFNRSIDGSQLQGQKQTLMNSEKDPKMISSNYDNEVPEMAKTSMFGGHLAAAEALQSADRSHQPTNYLNSNNYVDGTADSCFSINGSSVCPSPSPTNKASRGGGQESFINMGFLERMAKQQSAIVTHREPQLIPGGSGTGKKPQDDPMSHTFSSLSPKHQASAQVESKNALQMGHNNPTAIRIAEDQAFINPFSIAARKDSDPNTEGEVTAEGFFKAPELSAQVDKRDENDSILSPGHSRQQSSGLKPLVPGQQQLSPFDVVLQEQQKQQITRKVVPKMPADKTSKRALKVDVPARGRASNPMAQIQKLQIVDLNQSQMAGSQISGRNPKEQAVFKIKRSQIIPHVNKISSAGQTPNESLIEANKIQVSKKHAPPEKQLSLYSQQSKPGEMSGVNFNKQSQRESTGATNLSSRPISALNDINNSIGQNAYENHSQHNVFNRLKSIEKINEERVQLVGLKNQSAARKNEVAFTDAFDVDLQVSSDYGALHDLEQVDQMRSINSVSMNQGASPNLNNNALIPPSQHTYLNQQQTSRDGPRNVSSGGDHQVGRKNLTQSRGNPFQPASPATSDSLKVQLQEQAAYDRNKKFLQHVKIATSQSQDRRSGRQNQHNQKNMASEMFSPNLQVQKAGIIRLNSESRRVNSSTNQPFNNLFSQKDFSVVEQFASPRSSKLAVPSLGIGAIQVPSGTPFDKQSNQFGLFVGENDPLSELNSPKLQQSRQAMGALGNGNVPNQGFFHDLHVLNHSATQDINGLKDFSSDYYDAQNQQQAAQQPFQNTSAGATVKLGMNKRVSVHQMMQGRNQQLSLLRSQLQTREDQNFRKINSQGLMQPTYTGLEPYSTIEGQMSVDHFPEPPVHHSSHVAHGKHVAGSQHEQNIMSSHGLKRGDSMHVAYLKQGGPSAAAQVGHKVGAPQLSQRQHQMGRFYDNYLSPGVQQQQQQSQQNTTAQNQSQQPSLGQKGGCSIRPVASKHIPQVFRQNHQSRARRNGSDQRLGIDSRGSTTNNSGANGSVAAAAGGASSSNSHHNIRQSSNQKQRSFSNDARIMLHESKNLEKRLQHQQQQVKQSHVGGICSLDSSLVLKMHTKQKSMHLQGDSSTVGQGLFSTNYTDVGDFEIYDRKFKGAPVKASHGHEKGDKNAKTAMYETPTFQHQMKMQNLQQVSQSYV